MSKIPTRSRVHKARAGITSAVLTVLLFGHVSPARASTYAWTQTDKADFDSGTLSSSAVATASGDIELYRDKTSLPASSTFAAIESPTPDPFRPVDAGSSVKLGQSHAYTYANLLPPYPDLVVNHSFYDASTGMLFVSTNHGLSVIDTKMTANPDDDVLLYTYDATNYGVLNSDIVNSSFYDASSSLIFASTNDGLMAIDPSKDVNNAPLAAVYADGLKVNDAFLSKENLLYISTDLGLYVIANQGNLDGGVANNFLVSFSDHAHPTANQSSAAIISPIVHNAFLADTATSSFLFINSDQGVSEIDLGGASADILSSTTMARVVNNYVAPSVSVDNMANVHTAGSDATHSFLDRSGSSTILFVSTDRGLSVFDLGDLAAPGDDRAVENFLTPANMGNVDPSISALSSNINLPDNTYPVRSAFYGGQLYIGDTDFAANGGLMVVSLGDIASTTDDTLTRMYTDASAPPIIGNAVSNLYIDNGNLYVSTDKGLSVIHSGAYNGIGEYYSQPISIPSGSDFRLISAGTTVSAGQSATVESRFGDDLGNWTDWKAGSDIGGYPATSTLFQYRAILTSSSTDSTPSLDSVDIYSSYAASAVYTSKIYDASSTMIWRNIGIYADGTNISTRTRSGSTATPDGQWSQWWPIATSSTVVPSPNGRYFQYELTLSSSDPKATPVIHSVTVNYEDVPTQTIVVVTSGGGGSVTQTTQMPPIQTATSTEERNAMFASTTPAASTNKEVQPTVETAATDGQVKGIKIFFGIFDAIMAEAQILKSGDVNAVLENAGKKRNITAEFDNYAKYVKNILKSEKKLTQENIGGILNFIAYGTGTTKKMAVDDRANIMNTYRDAFLAVPKNESEWIDALRMSNGQTPAKQSKKAEDKAKKNFKIVYKRAPNLKNANDALAIKIMAYGIYTPARNMKAETEAVAKFKKTYGYKPNNFSAWNVVRGIAYSGIKK